VNSSNSSFDFVPRLVSDVRGKDPATATSTWGKWVQEVGVRSALGDLLRIVAIAATLFGAVVALLVRSFAACFRDSHHFLSDAGKCLTWALETLGGGCVKLGQILATRTDVLPEEFAIPLQRLHDSMAPFSFETVRSIIERTQGLPLETLFCPFEPAPVGSGSVAQVHRAVLRKSGTEVAVKVRRPGINRTIRTDSRIFVALVRGFSFLPRLRGMPLIEAVQQVAMAVEGQASLLIEAESHRRFCALFESGVPVRVPRLFEEYCCDDVLVMEYFPGFVKITAPELSKAVRRTAVIAGLHGLYRMLFIGGLVHCDMHPGNVLVGPDGDVVLVDFGFSRALPSSERAAFTDFFLSIALADGATAAKIILDTALRIPAGLDRAGFEGEVGELVGQSSGLKAGEFLVAAFVQSLFGIQRRHGIYGSPTFTLAILSLIVYEGIIRQCCPDLNFQREAVPTLLLSSQESADSLVTDRCRV
jgi:ubiquinone biosynthesis protein